MKFLAHIGEPVEEHPVQSPVQNQTTDVGFYFFGGIVILAASGFLVWKILKKRNGRKNISEN
ncbi:MAG: hypothetical protein A3H02_01540 [Candidatus Niyogibacteria bacterium RIFCSPLOWO2_12_FULL_41_13]|uniref:Uncharacterized protein n=1 Tax=Candidatus Niyogibacteria bacterium RIFCSPLOWO2_12_FULL_41_13 TaxID=1801726 RepID=A0A1G2F5H0_9BACT|nr:MAG: hypothetical protein A3H02_01540 [Candidatus Niyogibacteria bacterium RIFCSPLOWO2_12_FULL_41_13]